MRDFRQAQSKKFIEFFDERDCKAAFTDLDGAPFKGGRLSLRYSWDYPREMRIYTDQLRQGKVCRKGPASTSNASGNRKRTITTLNLGHDSSISSPLVADTLRGDSKIASVTASVTASGKKSKTADHDPTVLTTIPRPNVEYSRIDTTLLQTIEENRSSNSKGDNCSLNVKENHSPNVKGNSPPNVKENHSPKVKENHPPDVKENRSPDIKSDNSPNVKENHSSNIKGNNSPNTNAQISVPPILDKSHPEQPCSPLPPLPLQLSTESLQKDTPAPGNLLMAQMSALLSMLQVLLFPFLIYSSEIWQILHDLVLPIFHNNAGSSYNSINKDVPTDHYNLWSVRCLFADHYNS